MTQATVTQTALPPGNIATVDDRIFAAALHLLRTRGPIAVNIESVASAAGVAKTTIYRRFDNRDALLSAVVNAATTAVSFPPDLSAYDTLHWFLGDARDMIERIVGRGAIAAILVDDDPELTAHLIEMLRVRSRPIRNHLRRRAAAGELRPDLDLELVLSLLLGTFVAESIRGETARAGWADDVLRLLWPALAATPMPLERN